MRVLLCKPNISEGARQNVIEAVRKLVANGELARAVARALADSRSVV